jgi:hypothetical protein
MTSTPFTSDVHNADGHPDVAEISAFTEDLLSPEHTAALHRHLSFCELCADVRASLDEIRGSLGTLPGPVRMPANVAGRIDAALAAEAMLDASPSNAPAVSRETRRASRERGRRTKPGREAAAPKHAAAAVSRETSPTHADAPGRSTDRPSGHPGGASRPGRHRPARRPRRWRSAVLVGAGAIAALGIGGLVMQSLNSPAPPSATANTEREERTASADGALKKHVQSLLAAEEAKGKPKGVGTPDLKSKQSPKNSPLVGGAVSVPSCIRAGIDRTENPLAVDAKAPYKGGTGFLVVLPHRGASQRVDAYVVDPSCISRESTGPGEVLMTRTYARH